jgi:glycerophosphoryl diester phosphodiesterase
MPNSKIIAHRGASGHAPENTMAAFQLAMEQGADGIELDVMLSKDGRLVVFHDHTVDRTTNGTGRVKDMTLAQLQSLDAGNGEKIPTLEEVLKTYGGQLLINIDLRNYATPFDGLARGVGELLSSNGFSRSVIVSAFNPFNLVRIRRLCPEVKLGLLTLPNMANLWIWRLFKYDALHPHYKDVDRDLVETVRSRHQQVNVWTVDDPDEIRRLAALNVDSLITNFPEQAREALESGA